MGSVEYTWLGHSGIKVSNICLGTMTFGIREDGRPSCSEEESHSILDKFVELGGNFIDTADLYQFGKAEEIIGKWLVKQQRDKLIVATKCGKNMDPKNPNAIGASRSHILNSIERSLKRLQTDYIDLYYIHVWDEGTPIEETVTTLHDLVRAGKIRYIGMSNAKGWQMQKIIEVCKRKGLERFICLQQQYSLLCRSVEWEVAEVCKYENLGLLPWSPLKGGWLAGKVTRGKAAPEEGSRMAWAGSKKGRAHHSHPDFDWFANDERAFNVIDKCQEIGKKYGKSIAQVSLRWLLQKPEVPSVVIGVRTLQQLEDNMGAGTGWKLTEEEMEQLNQVSAIPAPYPYDYIPNDNKTRHRP